MALSAPSKIGAPQMRPDFNIGVRGLRSSLCHLCLTRSRSRISTPFPAIVRFRKLEGERGGAMKGFPAPAQKSDFQGSRFYSNSEARTPSEVLRILGSHFLDRNRKR